MKVRRQLNKSQRQGKSLVLLLIVGCAIILGCVAGYFHLQRKSVEEARERQAERVADAQMKLERDVEVLLESSETAVKEFDTKALKRIIRKVSILDVNSNHAQELSLLKLEFKKLEKRDAQIKVLRGEFDQAIQNENISRGAKIIEDLQKVSEKTTDLEGQLVRLKKHVDQRDQVKARCYSELNRWDLKAAEKSLAELRVLKLSEVELTNLSEAIEASKLLTVDAEKSAQSIRDRDTGEYSAEVSHDIAELLKLYKGYPALLQLQKKFAAYPQTVRVPGDVASLDAALEMARAGDRIELGEGVFYAESIINKAVTIVGAGREKTILESFTINGPALRFTHKQGKSSMSGVSVRGDRESSLKHSLIVVDGAELDMRDCQVRYSPGHGLAVVSGNVAASSCVFSDNSWDGVSVSGTGSKVTLGHCSSQFNVEHGVDFWGGAQGVLLTCNVSDNSKTGVVVMGKGTVVTASGVKNFTNREAGFYVAKQAKLVCSAVVARGNMFSGFVLTDAGSTIELKNTSSNGNQEFGYLVDPAATLIHQSPLKGESNLLGLKGQK